MANKVIVAGVGMIPFTKPGKSKPFDVMAAEAIGIALRDAGLEYADLQQAYAAYVYGESTCGQLCLYSMGMTGIPVFNVNNNCSSGSSALFLARQAVEAGQVDCAIAFGFEQMVPGALPTVWSDRPTPFSRWNAQSQTLQPSPGAYPAPHLFGGAGLEYQRKYGTRPETFAQISVKARRHAEHNERAIFRAAVTLEEVLASPPIYGPLTRLQCCPPTCGSAAAILVSESFAARRRINSRVRILGQAMATDLPSTFEAHSMIMAVGYDMTQVAAQQVYKRSGIGPDELDVVELHDCFSANELISYEALGLTAEGTAERFIWDGDNTYGGKVVTNPSGGLLSKGHPLGATGLAQCTELVEQLRGASGARQVDGAEFALQHNIGIGGACVVTMYGNV
jgi:sterol carrier protein 2